MTAPASPGSRQRKPAHRWHPERPGAILNFKDRDAIALAFFWDGT
jgi:hypothetical protein